MKYIEESQRKKMAKKVVNNNNVWTIQLLVLYAFYNSSKCLSNDPCNCLML